ncbi:MAG: Brp/Blh family beta-carotene 15,15'-dioxygenase [Bacteroidota bacterium]
MNIQLNPFYKLVMGFTLLILLLSLWTPVWLQQIELFFFIACMVLTGIPHGATDHLVYAHVQKTHGHSISYVRFLGFYLVGILMYGVLWYFFPTLSLVVFLFISIYHFGQSQLLYLKASEKNLWKIGLYLLWGSTVLAGIILFHWESSYQILSTLIPTQFLPVIPLQPWISKLPWVLGGISLCSLLWAYKVNWMSKKQVIFEGVNLLALMCLFYVSTLLVSFAVYFGLWHALASIHSELKEMQLPQGKEVGTLGTFFKMAWPLTLISLLGLLGLLVSIRVFNAYISPYLIFFIAISTLTLPHMYFMDKLYQLERQKFS